MFFLIAPTSFIHYLPRAFLALLHGLIFISLPLRHIYPLAFLTLWHFESVQKCKVCMGVISELYIDLHGCTFCIFKFQNADNAGNAGGFFFSLPQSPVNPVQPYIYAPILNQTKKTKMMTDEKRRTLRCRSESSESAKVSKMTGG